MIHRVSSSWRTGLRALMPCALLCAVAAATLLVATPAFAEGDEGLAERARMVDQQIAKTQEAVKALEKSLTQARRIGHKAEITRMSKMLDTMRQQLGELHDARNQLARISPSTAPRVQGPAGRKAGEDAERARIAAELAALQKRRVDLERRMAAARKAAEKQEGARRRAEAARRDAIEILRAREREAADSRPGAREPQALRAQMAEMRAAMRRMAAQLEKQQDTIQKHEATLRSLRATIGRMRVAQNDARPERDTRRRDRDRREQDRRERDHDRRQHEGRGPSVEKQVLDRLGRLEGMVKRLLEMAMRHQATPSSGVRVQPPRRLPAPPPPVRVLKPGAVPPPPPVVSGRLSNDYKPAIIVPKAKSDARGGFVFAPGSKGPDVVRGPKAKPAAKVIEIETERSLDAGLSEQFQKLMMRLVQVMERLERLETQIGR